MGTLLAVDIGAALGFPAEPWWSGDAVEPAGLPPILLTYLPDSVDVAVEGQLAAHIRW